MACHRRVEERLEMMGRAAAHLGDQREAALDAFAAAFRFMDTSGALHTADEEESLFPRLMPLLESGERDYLSGLEHDHPVAHGLYADLKAAVAQFADEPQAQARLSGLVERLARIYRRHIASENETLQAIARQRL